MDLRLLLACLALFLTSAEAPTYKCPSPKNPSLFYEQKTPCGVDIKPGAVQLVEKPNCEGLAGGSPERVRCIGQIVCLSKSPNANKSTIEQCAANYLTQSLAKGKEVEDQKAALLKLPEPKIGMLTFEARDSRWGQPSNIRRTQTVGADWENWTYFNTNRELHFKNGELVLIRR